MKTKLQQKNTRHARIRAKIKGTAERPRFAVYRSNTAMYAQLIDDTKAHTIASADTRKSKAKSPSEKAIEVGKTIADAAKKAKIDTVVFDRGGFLFTGSIKAVADAAREAGLKF